MFSNHVLKSRQYKKIFLETREFFSWLWLLRRTRYTYVYYMFVVCSLQAHSMFTVCLLNVRCMLTVSTLLKQQQIVNVYVCALTERRLLFPCLRTFEQNCECILEQEQFLIIRNIFMAIWYFHLTEKCFCSQTIFVNENNVFTEWTTLSWENATTKHWENFKKVLQAFLKKMSWNFLAANFQELLGEF